MFFPAQCAVHMESKMLSWYSNFLAVSISGSEKKNPVSVAYCTAGTAFDFIELLDIHLFLSHATVWS